jgi:hypothetical protein
MSFSLGKVLNIKIGNDLNPGLWRTEMRQSFRAEAFQSILTTSHLMQFG